MALSIKINGIVVLAEQGFTINTLTDLQYDSGYINLPLSSRELSYEPADIIEIFNNDIIIFKLRVKSDKSTSLGSSGLFRHDLTVVEETKILERILTENRVIRNETGKPTVTLLDVFDTVVKYVPDYNFVLESGLSTLLDTVSTPDITLNLNTLKELLNVLWNEVNGVPRLISIVGNTITLGIDLYTQRKSQINTNALYKENQRSLEDYYSSYKAVLSNATVGGSVITGGFWYPSPVSSVNVRAKDVVFNDATANVKLPEEKPIIKMVQVLLIGVPTDTLGNIDMDISPYVFEKTVWDSFEVGKDTSAVDLLEQNVQANTLYWQTNGVTIENMSIDWASFSNLWLSGVTINNVARKWLFQNGFDGTEFKAQDTELYNYRIFYDTIFDTETTIDASNVKDITRKSQGYYNQKGTFSDLLNLSTNMYNAVNRIGHLAEQGTEIITDFNNAYSLGDYELKSGTNQDEVIYGLEWTFYNRYIVQKFLKMKSHTRAKQRIEVENSILKSRFDKPVFRKHLTEMFIEFSFSNTSDTTVILTSLGKKVILNSFGFNSSFNKPAYIGHFNKGEIGPFSSSIYTPIFSYGDGNTIHLDSSFKDTINAMQQLSDDGGNALSNKNVPYANLDGTLSSYSYHISSDAPNSISQDDFPFISTAGINAMVAYSGDIDKSAGEILGLITRISFISSIDSNRNNKFIIGKQLLLNNSLVKDVGIGDTLSIWTSTEKYDIFDNAKAKGTKSGLGYSYDSNTHIITLSSTVTTYWALANDNGDLYLACNVFPVGNLDPISMNFLDKNPNLTTL